MMNKKPLRVIDWAAIRKAYEAGDVPVRVIAGQHGTSSNAIDHRMRRGGWRKRRDRARLAKGLESLPRNRPVDWDVVRGEYENGGFSIKEICARHRIAVNNLYSHRNAGGWTPRREAFPKAFGAGGTIDTVGSLRSLVDSAVAKLVADGKLTERINLDDPLRGLHTLATVLHRIGGLKSEEERRDERERNERLIIDDASREILAQRLDDLARAWKHERDSQPPDSEGSHPD